jgi:hypothetical protein
VKHLTSLRNLRGESSEKTRNASDAMTLRDSNLLLHQFHEPIRWICLQWVTTSGPTAQLVRVRLSSESAFAPAHSQFG